LDEKASAFQRLFVAIAVPEAVRECLARAQGQLRRCAPPGAMRWTRPEQFHLTLKFLGDVPAGQIARVEQSLNDACAPVPAWPLSAGGIGFFPGRHKPRVVWAGVADDANRLAELHRRIDQALRSFAPPEQPGKFTGHITLGRFKPGRNPARLEFWKRAEVLGGQQFGQWTPAAVEIIRCDLTSAGARHTRLAACPLAF
jgi:2'-5' RNA ligase